MAPSPSPSTTASMAGSTMDSAGAPETWGPPKTMGTDMRRLTARATSTDQRWVMVYELNATTSGLVSTIRAAVLSGDGSSKRARNALSGPLFEENIFGS
ncbi:MAG TPA: hypothetical protein VGL81_25300 [Polyangiaceae bacterium]